MGKKLEITFCSDEIVVFSLYIDMGKKLESTFVLTKLYVFSLCI